ncbi:MAG: 4-hydroxy-3-methylbut-2-enyl diphosphate reductase [Bryobacteraceae bacterium]
MKLLLASPRGFCAGVAMAVECLEKALQLFPPPIFVFHEIVHNRSIVEQFSARGVVFVDTMDAVPPGSTVVFSAHGVSPQIEQAASARGLRVIDATCPLVAKVHREARRFADQGYVIALVGHEGHDEVVGVVGVAPDNIIVIESERDLNKLKAAQSNRFAYLSQTTLSVDDTRSLVQILRKQYPDIQGPPTEDICYATQNRQEALSALLPDAQLVLVIGSANSSNTQRLVELVLAYGTLAKRIEGPEEIAPAWFEGVETAALTSGASVPEALVWGTVDWLRARMPIELEHRTLRKEHQQFPLPAALRASPKMHA